MTRYQLDLPGISVIDDFSDRKAKTRVFSEISIVVSVYTQHCVRVT